MELELKEQKAFQMESVWMDTDNQYGSLRNLCMEILR